MSGPFDCPRETYLATVWGMKVSAQSLSRVLLVEDEPKLRRTLADGLGLEHWEVSTAASGGEALLHLESESFDVIVLDWMLPDCDGLQIVRQLRSNGNHTPVLIISARAGPGAEAAVQQSGANGYLAKPFSFDDLLARTRALLNEA